MFSSIDLLSYWFWGSLVLPNMIDYKQRFRAGVGADDNTQCWLIDGCLPMVVYTMSYVAGLSSDCLFLLKFIFKNVSRVQFDMIFTVHYDFDCTCIFILYRVYCNMLFVTMFLLISSAAKRLLVIL